MPPASIHAIADRLTTLRQAYAGTIPAHMDHIRDLHDEVVRAAWNSQAVTRLLARVHDFTGATATFGFNELGERSRVIERALRTLTLSTNASSEIAATVTEQSRISALVSDLLAQPRPDADHLTPLSLPQWDLPQHSATELDHGTQRIFVVDDNALLAEQVAEQIRYFGYQVEIFTTLAAFEAAYLAAPPDAVVLDIEFPDEETTGPASIGRLMHAQGAVAPVVFISSYDDIQARLAAARAGGSRYLLKPVAVNDLIDALDALLTTHPPQAHRVLIIDDSVAVSHLYGSILESAGMKVKIINNPLLVLDALAEFHPDIALVDLYMPECSGHEVAMVIRQVEAYLDLPIVFLSAENDRDKQLSAMRLGADDFLTKPIQPHHLIAAVANRADRASFIRALVRRDPLTGLLNHSALLEMTGVELARARRNKASLTLAIIDIDNFKAINQTHGHPTGDRVLRSLARQLKQRLRVVDLIGRYGGEEFAVVFSATPGADALQVINSIREDFARVAHSSSQSSFHATFSCGLASVPDFVEVQRLLDAADRGLYEAKRRGRNCAVLTTPPAVKAV
jgi:diguanylate cyclase (GGDEF)-like protein